MYDFKYVKKRKTRIWVTIGAGISTLVVSTFAIVSFLGRFVGTFTVSLETGEVALTMSKTHDFEETTSYLEIPELPTFNQCTYKDIIDYPVEELDSDIKDYTYGMVNGSLKFLKYTFYLKNVGGITASYDLTVNIMDSKSDGNSYALEESLRFMIYDNYEDEGAVTHEKVVYAYESKSIHENEGGTQSNTELISTKKYGYAENFINEKVIVNLHEERFEKNQIKRYTFVMWLEGEDPEGTGIAPRNARMRIGAEIKAFKYEK